MYLKTNKMWDCSGESIYHSEHEECMPIKYLSVYLYYIHVEHWKKKNYIYKDTLNNILVLLYLEKTTDLSQVTKKLDHIKFYQVHFTYFKHHNPLIIIILPVHINYLFISCLNQKVTIKKEAV